MLNVAKVETVELCEDWAVTIAVVPVMPGVTAKIYDGETLVFEVGKAEITLEYNDYTRELLEDIDEFEAVELLALIAEYGRLD